MQEILRLAAQLWPGTRQRDPRYFAAATVEAGCFPPFEKPAGETEALLDSLPKVESDPNELYPSLYLAQGKKRSRRKSFWKHICFSFFVPPAWPTPWPLPQERDGTDRALFLCGLSLRLAELFDLEDAFRRSGIFRRPC